MRKLNGANDVESAEGRNGVAHEPLHVVVDGDAPQNLGRPPARVANGLRYLSERLRGGGEVKEADVVALAREADRDCFADPGRSPGDDRDTLECGVGGHGRET